MRASPLIRRYHGTPLSSKTLAAKGTLKKDEYWTVSQEVKIELNILGKALEDFKKKYHDYVSHFDLRHFVAVNNVLFDHLNQKDIIKEPIGKSLLRAFMMEEILSDSVLESGVYKAIPDTRVLRTQLGIRDNEPVKRDKLYEIIEDLENLLPLVENLRKAIEKEAGGIHSIVPHRDISTVSFAVTFIRQVLNKRLEEKVDFIIIFPDGSERIIPNTDDLSEAELGLEVKYVEYMPKQSLIASTLPVKRFKT